MNRPMICRSIAITLGVIAFVEQGRATTITVPPGDWVFQNTAAATATDFQLLVFNPSLDFDTGVTTGGPNFPNPRFTSASVGGQPFAVFNSTGQPGQPMGPGIPLGGFYSFSFLGYPPGTQIDVRFSYTVGSTTITADPGRVYQRVGTTMSFEFVPQFSPAGPLTGPPPDFTVLFNMGGRAAPVPEPSAFGLTALGVFFAFVYAKGRR